MPLIEVDHVTHGYGHTPVLHDVSLSVEQGEIMSLLGPNGSGKTTLLKLLLGLHRPRQGRVLLDGRPVDGIPPKQLARRIAYVPQVHRITFGYRAMDVVLMGRMCHKPFFFKYGKADEKIAMEALAKLSVDHLSERPYSELSGGERQLVIISRALAQGADIFILDEPVNGLDYGNQIRLLGRIAELAGNGYTFIKTTHFPDHAIWISDRVVMLKEGRIVADGETLAVADEENLRRLYEVPIGVVTLEGGFRVCVPKNFQCRSHCPSV